MYLSVNASMLKRAGVGWGSICLWVSMTTLNREEITLCSDSVDQEGPTVFESQWQHWTVKISLCALPVLQGGFICLWVSMTTLNSEEITLCSASVNGGVYLPLVSASLYMCTGISLYFLISWLFWMGSHWSLCKARRPYWWAHLNIREL